MFFKKKKKLVHALIKNTVKTLNIVKCYSDVKHMFCILVYFKI